MNEAVLRDLSFDDSVAWLAERPTACVIVLLFLTLILRLALMEMVGFGNDEAYTLAGARVLHLSYFDHPPLHV